ncbi:MAG: hypothetical protein WC821_02040 [archaeon]|jgi:hypothetical protein
MTEIYKPIIGGIVHTDDALKYGIQFIDDLAKKGIKSIGLERGVSKQDLAWLKDRIIDPIERSEIEDFAKGIFFLHTPVEDDYWSKLNNHAKNRGLKVIEMDSGRAHRVSEFLRLFSTIMNIPANHDLSFFQKYVEVVSRDKHMNKVIMRTKPQAVLCGIGHAFAIAKNSKQGIKDINFITENGISLKNHSELDARKLAGIYRFVTREKIQLQKERTGKTRKRIIRCGKMRVEVI